MRGTFPLMMSLAFEPRARRTRPNLTLRTERRRGRAVGREGEAGERGGEESWLERGRTGFSGEEGDEPKVEEKERVWKWPLRVEVVGVGIVEGGGIKGGREGRKEGVFGDRSRLESEVASLF